MKDFLINLFSESSKISMLRLMSLIVCITGCYLALSKGPDEIAVISVLLGTAFGGKISQKFIEVKKDQNG